MEILHVVIPINMAIKLDGEEATFMGTPIKKCQPRAAVFG